MMTDFENQAIGVMVVNVQIFSHWRAGKLAGNVTVVLLY